MKKKSFIIMLIFTVMGCKLITNNAFAATTRTDKNELIATLLAQSIENAIQGYYGESRQFDLFDTKIENIKKASNGEFVFKVQVHIRTFEGAHNPPYGSDTLYFTVTPSSVILDKYEHRDEEILTPMS